MAETLKLRRMGGMEITVEASAADPIQVLQRRAADALGTKAAFVSLVSAGVIIDSKSTVADLASSDVTLVQHTEPSTEAVTDAFNRVDTDGSGHIDAKELKQAMIAAGLDPSPSTVRSIICTYDDKGEGTINFQEFLQLMKGETDTEELISFIRALLSIQQ
mmetsp:Transcript_22976/g.52581  ORF Transcript_22976/g.52581 Transcript_22976/m.52581 type:complete len:161 (-) Transcript_22976:73-555(-)